MTANTPNSSLPPLQLFWIGAEREAFYRLVEQLLHENNTIRSRLEQFESRKGTTLSTQGVAYSMENQTFVFKDYARVLLKQIYYFTSTTYSIGYTIR